MNSRKMLVVGGFLLLVGTAVALPHSAAAQARGDRFQQILDLLMSFGDVSSSWSRALPAQERFVVLAAFNDEAVLDRNTGLVWERVPHITERGLPSASYHCLNASIGGQKGWRLPSITELTSLIDPAGGEPTLPVGAPFDLRGKVFIWSATLRHGFDDLAWSVNFRHGFIDDSEFNLGLSVWCVRGGAKVDAY